MTHPERGIRQTALALVVRGAALAPPAGSRERSVSLLLLALVAPLPLIFAPEAPILRPRQRRMLSRRRS